jgi:hypothetical protein
MGNCLLTASVFPASFSILSSFPYLPPLYILARLSYSDPSMWPIDERFDAQTVLEDLPAAGFTVSSTRGVVRVEKYGCGVEFRQIAGSHYQMTIQPAIMLRGQFTRLWDAGYQKFLLTDDGSKFPALAEHLQNLRRFNEELRAALGVPTYYNESIGSVCYLSVYDRVKGRPGDIPEQSVGAKPHSSH